MGAAPVLIMLAAIGVDFGWQPDGTTSTRGDNIEYIVQISPEHLEQLQSIGEITSTIDPAVQNRVSRLVFRVGTGTLPRDAGRTSDIETLSPTSGGQSLNANANFGDQQNVPIPEIVDAIVIGSGPGDALAERTKETSSNAVMKPDPQGDGFMMPSGGPSNAARTSPSTSSFNGAPSTDPVSQNARSNAWSSFVGPPRPADPQALISPPLTNPLATTTPSPYKTSPSSSANGRDPSDPNWTGYGTSSNFGALPTASNPPAGGFNSPYQSTPTETAGSLTNSRSAPPPVTTANGYTQDAQFNIRDRENRLVDRNGYPIDPRNTKFRDSKGQLTDYYNNLFDVNGNQIDKFGIPIDSTRIAQANTPSAPISDPRFASLQAPEIPNYSSTAPTNYPSTTPTNNPAIIAPPAYAQTQSASAQRDAEQRALLQQQADRDREYLAQLRSNAAANTQVVKYDVETRSPSDAGLGSQSRSAMEQERAALAATTKSRNIAAQPLFNFVLLISLVGNAYLIFETNNLRRKFRNMISTLRSAKITGQPAA
jgi:hypothetical protein